VLTYLLVFVVSQLGRPEDEPTLLPVLQKMKGQIVHIETRDTGKDTVSDFRLSD